MSNLIQAAFRNFHSLCSNPYPGRGIIIGRRADGTIVQVYWIMGRSSGSRARVLTVGEGGDVFTEPTNPATAGDTSLTIYKAMREGMSHVGKHFVVSNGKQTDSVMDKLEMRPRADLNELLVDFQYEPDAPNFTPRITGLCSLSVNFNLGVELSILRKSPFGDGCDRYSFRYSEIGPGYGYGITTYASDGNPLPSFTGEPLLVPIQRSDDEILREYFRGLNQDNIISVAVKSIDPHNGSSRLTVANKYTRV